MDEADDVFVVEEDEDAVVVAVDAAFVFVAANVDAAATVVDVVVVG